MYRYHKIVKTTSVYGIYLNYEGKVLLIKDSSSGLWGLPGGGVEKSETDQEALSREFQEEVGLTINGEMHYFAQEEGSDKTLKFYSIIDVQGEIFTGGNADDILGAGFFSISDISLLNDAVPGLVELMESFRQSN